MSDDPTVRFPVDPAEPERNPDAPADPIQPARPRGPVSPEVNASSSRALGRDLALGAIAFVAVLLLLLGATRLMERGSNAPARTPSQ
ncbi:MAG TPA: hypothetical protein VM408_03665, partial [Methylomirabilota bacterium]|nr:hypothetical protein [Methylomirabilota bacterium]